MALLLLSCTEPSEPITLSPDTPFTIGSVTFPNDTVFKRAAPTLVHNGRLAKFLVKHARGDSLVIGFIGGSITEGAGSTAEGKRYSSLLTSWISRTSPRPGAVREVNAGLSATNSRFAASRVAVDLLAHSPDIVVIEFAVNDYISGDDDFIRAALEGVVRQCLAHDPDLAVVLLFTAKGDGNNVQELHAEIGRHYALPMISYRDAIMPLIDSGRIAWSDLFRDDPHPNDNGYRVAANLLVELLRKADRTPTQAGVALPAPYQSDLYQFAGILTSGDTTVSAALDGWTRFTSTGNRTGFVSPRPDEATLTLSTNHREMSLGIRMRPTDTSSIFMRVDNGPEFSLNNYYVIEYTRLIRMFSGPTRQPRTVTIRHSGMNRAVIDYVLYAR